MEILGKIRRLYLRDGLSLHEIKKCTGLSRNTIRSWLRTAEEAAPGDRVEEFQLDENLGLASSVVGEPPNADQRRVASSALRGTSV